MKERTVMVVAKHTSVEGVYSYSGYLWGKDNDGKDCYVGWSYSINVGETQRTIVLDVREDLSFRPTRDEVVDYRFEVWNNSVYESPEIASDDVAQDMVEVALATAFPDEYSARQRTIEAILDAESKGEVPYVHIDDVC